MRICHVTPHLPPDQGANALLPAQLGEWARAKGEFATFVAHEGPGPSASPVPGIRWVPRRRPGSWIPRTLRLDSLRTARAVSSALDEAAAGADLLHLHSNGLIVEIAARWAARRGTPYLLTMYGTEIWHYRRRRPVDFFTRAYRRAASVTFYSQRLLDRARAIGLDRPALHTIYPPVAESFAPRDEATRARWRTELGIAEPRVLLNVKRLHELAGQRFLIDAFARIARRRDDVRLIICGSGPLRATLEAHARDRNVSPRVTFTGLLPNTDIALYAAVADLFVLPSLLEALPTVAVEALASGTPVVSADHPGGVELSELFGDDVQVVPRRDVEALARAIDDALGSPRRTTPGTDAMVRARFRREGIEAAYWRVYREALTAGRT